MYITAHPGWVVRARGAVCLVSHLLHVCTWALRERHIWYVGLMSDELCAADLLYAERRLM